jgi:hypothetical protein
MAKKPNLKNVRDAKASDRVNFGINKTLTKKKWKQRKNLDGSNSQFMERTSVHENALGQKFKRRSIKSGIYGGTSDRDQQQRILRGETDNLQGRSERSSRVADKEEYDKNFKQIEGFEEKEKTKQGLPMPKKFKKTYK